MLANIRAAEGSAILTVDMIEQQRRLLQCMSPLVALFGHVTMSDLSPQSDPKRTLLVNDFDMLQKALLCYS